MSARVRVCVCVCVVLCWGGCRGCGRDKALVWGASSQARYSAPTRAHSRTHAHTHTRTRAPSALKTKGNTPKYGLIFNSSVFGRGKQGS